MQPPTFRWWVVAKTSMRLAVKKKGFWIASCISAYWYLIMGAVFYFADLLSQRQPLGNASNLIFNRIVWKDQFLDAFSISQLMLLIVALMIGAGSIASDNRANALLVYLSKPCTKRDYLFGKWVSIFLPLLGVVAVPALLFFGYCYMSYGQYGFVSQDPALFWKLLLIFPLPAALHASLSLGISSMFKQARLAGATYAALFFLSFSFTIAIRQVIDINDWRDEKMGFDSPSERSHPAGLLDSLFYCSIDGVQIGLAKDILGTNGSPPLGAPVRSERIPPAPNAGVFGLIYLGLCAAGVGIAWSRARAVEVVKG